MQEQGDSKQLPKPLFWRRQMRTNVIKPAFHRRLGHGHQESMDKRRAICLRLTPHTTAREQANRITLLLIGWEVETPLISGVQYPRWFWSSRDEP